MSQSKFKRRTKGCIMSDVWTDCISISTSYVCSTTLWYQVFWSMQLPLLVQLLYWQREERPWKVQKESLPHDQYRLPQHSRRPQWSLHNEVCFSSQENRNDTTHLTNLSCYLMEKTKHAILRNRKVSQYICAKFY